MKSKKILTILLSLAIMFTFMPAMAFAQDYNPEDIPSTGKVTDISWGSDYHTASVKVKTGTTTKTLNFEYFDTVKGMEATKADVQACSDGLVKYVVYISDMNSDYSVDYSLGMAQAKKQSDSSKYEYAWEVVGDDPLDVYNTEDFDDDELNAYNVFDAYVLAAYLGYDDNGKLYTAFKPDAGEYAAWYAQKDFADNLRTYKTGSWIISGLWEKDDKDITDDVLSVTYPEYNAYEVGADKKDMKLAISMTFNAEGVKAVNRKAKIAGTTGNIELIPSVDEPNHSFYTRHVTNTNEGTKTAATYLNAWYIEDDDTYNLDYGKTYDNNFTYDGKSHNIVWVHEPKGVTIKYYVSQLDKNGKYVAPKAADWTTTFPGIKDAGKYEVAIQFVTEKNGTTWNEEGQVHQTVVVNKAPVKAAFKQDVLRVEYGKYDATSLEAAVKGMLYPMGSVDVTDKVQEAISKYVSINGLFEDAGASKLTTVVNKKGLSDDAELAAALANYELVGGDEMTLVIEKATNDTNLKAVTKSFKAKKKTKKLAKKKSFKLSATADFGTVMFKKVSGNAKITVSSAGKVTVKKGLKKGTYKVKVKAYTKGTANYAAGSDTQTIVVKIK